MKSKKLPPAERLRQLLDYCPDTGIFRWKVKVAQRCAVGSVAGTIGKRGYVHISVDKAIYAAHRLAWAYQTGQDPGEMEVDHKNGERSQNAFCNLRLATREQNMRNVKLSSRNKSGLKGVYWVDRLKKYRACIRVDGKTNNLGCFTSAEEAHDTYMRAAERIYLDFSRSS